MKLSPEQIKRWYKIGALAVAAFSFLVFLKPGQNSISASAGQIIGLNMAFHLFYFFWTYVPVGMLIWAKGRTPAYKQMVQMMYFFSFVLIGISLFTAFTTVLSNWQGIFNLPVLFGLFLGGLSFNQKVRQVQQEERF